MRSRGGQDAAADMAEPDTPIDVTTNGQLWRTTWHPPTVAPPGTAHGSTALCFAADRIVLVSDDGRLWQLPGGRPEAAEDWAATLRREVREEACATVVDCRLPGFSRGACLRGPEAGVVLVRALWRAEVRPIRGGPSRRWSSAPSSRPRRPGTC